jgi:uncharacterized membrane protein (UPF0136 family)
MNGYPTLHVVAAVVTALYGLVSLGGGLLGYVRAGSVASIIAGGIAGILLLLCAFGIFRMPVASLAGAIIIAVALLGRFVGTLAKHSEDFGEFAGSVLGVTALLIVAGGVLVIVVAALALVMYTRS